jgi:DNA (cytosine-5)-methyltransferase 1
MAMLLPRVVDLFCGAGGLSSGFIAAGFRVLCAIDHSASAVATYCENLGDHATEGDITEGLELPEATVFVGGPPCQGFSSAGLRKQGDTRNSLVACFAQLVCRYKPLAFVFENVEGFLTAEGGDRVFDLLRPVTGCGYRVHLRKVNVANYGVPQHRKRVIAIGGLGWDPTFPEPTHSAFGAPGAHRIGQHLPAAPTLQDSLSTLPPASTAPPGDPPGHFYRPLEGMDLERAEALKPGQTMRDLPQELWHESYRRRAFRRVRDGTPTERRGGAPAGVKRLRPDEPSKTITSGAVTEFLHPFEHRPLTLRECALLQTFPNDFVFFGPASEQAVLIGNAVPPRFARVIARSILKDLGNATPQRVRGALLSFVPTVSSGMSPALEHLTQRVRSTFLTRESYVQGTLWP